MDSGSDADDIYGDDAESQASYEFIDDDDEEDDPVVVDAGGPDSLGRPPELQTWQSALHESLSAAPSSSGAPGAGERKAARDYRTRVVALERKAATRAAMLVLRGPLNRLCNAARVVAAERLGAAAGDSAPSALAMLDAHQEKALGMLDITGQDVPYCMGALELNGWDRQRAINWHLGGAAASSVHFRRIVDKYSRAIDTRVGGGAAATSDPDLRLSESGRAALSLLDCSPADARPAKPVAVFSVAGHGATMASCAARPAGTGESAHIADVGTPASANVTLGFLPKRLVGGTLLRLSASSVEAREAGAGPDSLAVEFETTDYCNVYVCVSRSLVFGGFAPRWLHRQGFRVCTDCAVVAAREAHGCFVVYRAAALNPKRWRLGNNATEVPPDARVPGCMYFVVVTALDPEDAAGVQLATAPESVDPVADLVAVVSAGRGAAPSSALTPPAGAPRAGVPPSSSSSSSSSSASSAAAAAGGSSLGAEPSRGSITAGAAAGRSDSYMSPVQRVASSLMPSFTGGGWPS
ncbi:hypothetical protein FNF27_00096 [Cafeteria roenbergensis]|uniref:Uncharacterized protein n=1 Tax=Cafeteria roenbergensis TaxID=33653 RepID=A0A5A8EL50_CAFRO|nr:hypothetical protein FNF27_00096 [Cafeteria roenbergensis]